MPDPIPLKPEPAPQVGFDDFWRLYPRHADKAMCRAKWEAITNGGLVTRCLDRDSGGYVELRLQASPNEIVEGVKRYVKTLPRKPNSYDFLEPQFIALPATFLNRGRWMDET